MFRIKMFENICTKDCPFANKIQFNNKEMFVVQAAKIARTVLITQAVTNWVKTRKTLYSRDTVLMMYSIHWFVAEILF